MKKIIAGILLLFMVSTTSAGEYEGQTFAIDCSRGGFNNDRNRDRLDPSMMVDETRNINIHKGGRSKRGGTDNVNSTAIGEAPRIWGIYQYRLVSGTTNIVTADANGEILDDYNDASPIATGLTIDQSVHFETFNNLLYICTGNNKVQTWNGSGSTANITAPATDWNGVGGNVNYPRKIINHGRGASQRLWAIGGATDPYTVYYSALNPADNSSEADFATGAGTLFIDTGDGDGIINGIEYGDRLFLFSKNRVYIIDDTDTDANNWGWEGSSWEGGTATDRSVVKVANSLVSMTDNGTIYDVSTSQNYGDYLQATLTRPAYIDEWIRDNIKLSAISDFHVIYDPDLRVIYFFMVRNGETDVDMALCYFIDRGPEEGWVIHDNKDKASGYEASCSALVRKAVGDYKIYTGGWDDGFVWELQTANLHDNNNAYPSAFQTPDFHLGDPRATKRFDHGWILNRALVSGNYDIYIDIFVDGTYITQEAISLTATGALYGTGKYGTAVYGGVELQETSFPINRDGKRLGFRVYNNNISNDFFITMIMADFVSLGRQVE